MTSSKKLPPCKMITYESILQAQNRIAPYIHQTPLFSSDLLNQWLGHEIVFKAECLQKVGAFKARGGCNAMAALVARAKKIFAGGKTQFKLEQIVANSSGNHAQAVAWAASLWHIPATIYMPTNVSQVKAQATASYGAKIVLVEQRAKVDSMVAQAAQTAGTFWIPPYDDVDVIAGQGTATAEALQQQSGFDAIFAPCGGGGLISGSLIASRYLSPKTQVVGVEPALANDALRSRQQGKIQRLAEMPQTIADGARTLSISELTFHYVKQLDDFYQVSEDNIIYWSQWLAHLLKLRIEPTSAMTMDGVMQWIKEHAPKQKQKILVILSGGNVDRKTSQAIWKNNQLSLLPMDKYCK